MMPSAKRSSFGASTTSSSAVSGSPPANASIVAWAAGMLPASAVRFSTAHAPRLNTHAWRRLRRADTAPQPPPSISARRPDKYWYCVNPLHLSLTQPAWDVWAESLAPATTWPLDTMPDCAPDLDCFTSCTKRSWLSKFAVKAISSIRAARSGTWLSIDFPRSIKYISGFGSPRLLRQIVEAEMPPVSLSTRRVRLTKSPLAVPSWRSAAAKRGSSGNSSSGTASRLNAMSTYTTPLVGNSCTSVVGFDPVASVGILGLSFGMSSSERRGTFSRASGESGFSWICFRVLVSSMRASIAASSRVSLCAASSAFSASSRCLPYSLLGMLSTTTLWLLSRSLSWIRLSNTLSPLDSRSLRLARGLSKRRLSNGSRS
mmetsp:Transcript_38889/g.104415  ORF Transcript_38889/g.104415 Transcript_38889/m.104415 type:complete len:373 (+) Transcript_38889:719-1837(+)